MCSDSEQKLDNRLNCQPEVKEHDNIDLRLSLRDITESDENVSISDIEFAIQTMEKVVRILVSKNKPLPKINVPELESKDQICGSNFDNVNKLFRLRMAAISLLNRNHQNIVKLKETSRSIGKKSGSVGISKPKSFPNHKWNNKGLAHHGITKSRSNDSAKWKKVFQHPEDPRICNKDSIQEQENAETVNSMLDGDKPISNVHIINDNPTPEVTTNGKPPTNYSCYVCHNEYSESHHFYPKMCPKCGESSLRAREQMANLKGKVALVTGGRIKIGYETVLKLLRCGALVIATTRFPADAAKRFSHEVDFSLWKERLHIYALDLRYVCKVELFCDFIAKKYKRLDILIQNAAQTIRRPVTFYKHLIQEEESSHEKPFSSLIHSWESKSNPDAVCFKNSHKPSASLLLQPVVDSPMRDCDDENSLVLFKSNEYTQPGLPSSVVSSQLRIHPEDDLYENENSAELANQHFPMNEYDEDHQQVDLRPVNSWVLEADKVETSELVEVHLINYIAPYVILQKLTTLMKNTARRSDRCVCIVLVSSMEGKFNRLKTSEHPHTNCSKASLNMLVRTSASYYKRHGILLNAVDTGWVTDEDPVRRRIFRKKLTGEDFDPPLDSIDGASRIVHPVLEHFNNPESKMSGLFLKDYETSEW